MAFSSSVWLDWIVQCFTFPPTQYRLYGRRFLQVKRPNQQYQSTEGESCKGKQHKKTKKTQITHTVSLVPRVLDHHEQSLAPYLHDGFCLMLNHVGACIHANDERDDGDQSVRRTFASHVQSQQATSCGQPSWVIESAWVFW